MASAPSERAATTGASSVLDQVLSRDYCPGHVLCQSHPHQQWEGHAIFNFSDHPPSYPSHVAPILSQPNMCWLPAFSFYQLEDVLARYLQSCRKWVNLTISPIPMEQIHPYFHNIDKFTHYSSRFHPPEGVFGDVDKGKRGGKSR